MREDGAIIIDGIQADTTIQCCHCARHFRYLPGPFGTAQLRRCQKCDRFTCGRWECAAECIPNEAQLEYKEGRKNRYADTIESLRQQGGILL